MQATRKRTSSGRRNDGHLNTSIFPLSTRQHRPRALRYQKRLRLQTVPVRTNHAAREQTRYRRSNPPSAPRTSARPTEPPSEPPTDLPRSATIPPTTLLVTV